MHKHSELRSVWSYYLKQIIAVQTEVQEAPDI